MWAFISENPWWSFFALFFTAAFLDSMWANLLNAIIAWKIGRRPVKDGNDE